jgi:hypothetical protein
MPLAIRLTNYSIEPCLIQANAFLNESPTSWNISGSVDGLNWVILDTRTSISGWTTTSKWFNIDLTATGGISYNHFRFSSKNVTSIGELRYYGIELSGSSTTAIDILHPSIGTRDLVNSALTFPTVLSDRISFSDGSYADFGSQLFSLAQGFSATFTFKFTGFVGNNETLLALGNSDNTAGLFIMRDVVTGFMLFGYRSNGLHHFVRSSTQFSQGIAYNIAAIYNAATGATGQLELYVNGVLNAFTVPSLQATSSTFASTLVGKSFGGMDRPLTADIFKMNIYNRTITQAEVQEANTSLTGLSSNMTTLYRSARVLGAYNMGTFSEISLFF